MVDHVWPLVFFTVLAQMAAGGYLFLKISRFLPALMSFPKSIYKRTLTVLLIIASAALLISFTHLGTPKNAIFALCNFRTSWLSREVFFMAAFVGILLFENVFFRWFSKSASVSAIVSVVGLLILTSLVFSMAKIYRLETVISWNNNYSLLNFFSTALLSGIFLLIFLNPLKNKGNINSMLLTSIAFLIIQLVLFFGFSPATGNWKTIGIVLYVVVLIIVKLQILKVFPQNRIISFVIIILLGLAIILERYLFYISYQNVGI